MRLLLVIAYPFIYALHSTTEFTIFIGSSYSYKFIKISRCFGNIKDFLSSCASWETDSIVHQK